jgi:hypothetical protein
VTHSFLPYVGGIQHVNHTANQLLSLPPSVLQLYALRRLMQGSVEAPKAPLGNNARPLQPLHHRTVRTNIDFQNAKVGDSPTVLELTYS